MPRRRSRRRRTRRSGSLTPVIAAVAILTLVTAAAALGDGFFGDRSDLRGPRSVTVYLIDSSGSQRLQSAEDRESLLQQRLKRFERQLDEEMERRGVLIVANFASDASRIRQVELDLGDKAVGCSDEGGDCLSARTARRDDLLDDAESFVRRIHFGGDTDIVNGAFVRGATLATDYRLDTSGPRRLVVESDFLETACAPFDRPPTQWPPTAVDELRKCAVGPLSVGDLAVIELVSVQLTRQSSLAEVARAADVFLQFCTAIGGNCAREA